MKTYKVIKKSAGYFVKTLGSLEAAKKFAEQCCKANKNNDYSVCERVNGIWEEI